MCQKIVRDALAVCQGQVDIFKLLVLCDQQVQKANVFNLLLIEESKMPNIYFFFATLFIGFSRKPTLTE